MPAAPSPLDTTARLTLSVAIRLGPLFPPLSPEIQNRLTHASCAHLPGFVFVETSTSKVLGHWPSRLLYICSSFSSLRLKMMAHLDNASILRWTPCSYLALPAIISFDSIFFFLSCKLLEVKALLKWIQISACYCMHLRFKSVDLPVLPLLSVESNQIKSMTKAGQPDLGSFHQQNY